MDFLTYLIPANTVIRIIERVFFHVYRWQVKEYRWDRYQDYLTSRQGIWMLLHPWYWLGIAIAFYGVAFFYMQSGDTVPGIVDSMNFYIVFSGVSSLFQIMKRGLCRPQWTPRALLIIATTALAIVGAAFFLRNRFYSSYAQFFFLLTTPLFVSAFVFLTSFPANYFKHRTIEKAKAKIATMPNLKVIGITGSYGKSSTKEFLATILSTKYKVAKTPANHNSEIGVAQSVLRDVKAEYEIFVVEMGAYREGEIKAICDIVRPTIGVLTAVNEQHLSLFGSLEKTKKAKYELIEALPENGIAIFNADNRATRELSEQTLKSKKLYSTDRPSDVFATAMTVQPEQLSFSLIVEGKQRSVAVPLLGAHAVSNLLAAIAAAHAIGMTLEDIVEALKNIAPLDHALKPYCHPSGALILDDSYSANPDGVIVALHHLKLIPRKYKVLVMMPMIELGPAAKDAHRRVGEHIGEVCDLAIMTQKNFFSIMRKASKLPKEKIFVLSRSRSILNALAPYLNENSVILLENRIPGLITKTLTPNTQKI